MAAKPTPEDFDRIEALVRGGVQPFNAVRQHNPNLTLSSLRKADRERHQLILELGRDEQGSFAVTNLREIAKDRENAGAVKANELLLRDAGRLADRVTVAGDPDNPIEVVNPDIAAAIERFTRTVVQLARPDHESEPAGLAAGRGESPPRLPVAGLAGAPEPDAAAG